MVCLKLLISIGNFFCLLILHPYLDGCLAPVNKFQWVPRDPGTHGTLSNKAHVRKSQLYSLCIKYFFPFRGFVQLKAESNEVSDWPEPLKDKVFVTQVFPNEFEEGDDSGL